MSKHYSEAAATEILNRMKTIDLEADKDERMLSPDAGVLFERTMIKYDVLDSLATGVKSHCKLKYAGVTWKFRLLSTMEYMQLDSLTEEFIKSKFKKEMSLEVNGYVRMAVILNKAMSSCPEANDSILQINDLIHMDLNAFLGLYQEYSVFVEKCDLSLDTMSDEDFFFVLEAIEKKQLTYSELSHRTLARLAHFYSRYYKLVTQPEVSTPTPLSVDIGTTDK